MKVKITIGADVTAIIRILIAKGLVTKTGFKKYARQAMKDINEQIAAKRK